MAIYCAGCGKALGDDARFCSACGRPAGNAGAFTGTAPVSRPPFVRPRVGRKIAGVCQGLANHLGWDVTVLRVITVVLAVLTFPLGLIAYMIFWLVVPEEPLILPADIPAKPAA
ncbi:MAG TPA: PspC domain-containing protein [Acidobacteriaceae bacterium]